MKILLDCDRVITDLDTQVYKAARRLFKRKFPKPETWTHDFDHALGLNKNEHQYFLRQLKREDRIGYSVEFYPGAPSFIEYLTTGLGAEVVFVTAPWRGMNHWVEARYGLLEHFLGRKNYSIIFTSDKHHVEGDWIIDDVWKNMEKTPERGILFSRPGNEKARELAAHTVKDYTDIIEVLRK